MLLLKGGRIRFASSSSVNLWTVAFTIVEVNWVTAGTVGRELKACCNICSMKTEKKLIRMITLSIFWIVYKERNRWKFNGFGSQEFRFI